MILVLVRQVGLFSLLRRVYMFVTKQREIMEHKRNDSSFKKWTIVV
jgi:hypothetical protein